MSEHKKKNRKEMNPSKDVLTPVGDLLWRKKEDEDETTAEEMFQTPLIAGTAGVEC